MGTGGSSKVLVAERTSRFNLTLGITIRDEVITIP
jgi:hypothetical protein